MTNYRRIVLDAVPLDDAAVASQLNHYEYVAIRGTRTNIIGPGAKCVIILTAIDSKYATKSLDFKKLLAKEPTTGNIEIMIVTHEELTTHIKKYITQYRAEHPQVYLEHHEYGKFLTEAPKHVLVPPHSIATDDEVAAECKRLKTNKENFPKIDPTTDAQAIWFGARRTQVMKVARLSETVGEFPIYRYCK